MCGIHWLQSFSRWRSRMWGCISRPPEYLTAETKHHPTTHNLVGGGLKVGYSELQCIISIWTHQGLDSLHHDCQSIAAASCPHTKRQQIMLGHLEALQVTKTVKNTVQVSLSGSESQGKKVASKLSTVVIILVAMKTFYCMPCQIKNYLTHLTVLNLQIYFL
jgi:hypothetical protein